MPKRTVHSFSWQKVQRVYCVHWAHLSIWFVSAWLSSWQKVQRVYCVHWAHLSIWFVSAWLSAAGYSSLSARKWGDDHFGRVCPEGRKIMICREGRGGGISHQREDKRLEDRTLSASCPTLQQEETDLYCDGSCKGSAVLPALSLVSYTDKKKRKFSSYIRKFRMEQLQSDI
jgi:hypothetical protein